MDIEETEKGIKISVPIMTNIEENVIDNNYKRIVDEFSKKLAHEKDLLIAQRLIKNLQAELDKKDKIINAMAEEYSLEANTNVLDICACCNHNTEDCHGDYCKEALINYFTKKVEG